MTATKHYPPEFDLEIFAIPDPPPQIAAKVLEAARAADERVERFYRENPDAAEIDDRMNREKHERARNPTLRAFADLWGAGWLRVPEQGSEPCWNR